MSCLVAIKTPTGVLLGADTRCTSDNTIQYVAERKIRKLCDGRVLFALAGNYGDADLAFFALEALQWPTDVTRKFLVLEAVPAIRKALRDAGQIQKGDKQVEQAGATILIATGKDLYEICPWGNVSTVESEFWALGAGREYALGSLLATSTAEAPGRPDYQAFMALDAAAHFDSSCGPEPFQFEKTY